MKKKVSVLFAILFSITFIAFIPKASNQTPWPVPGEYKSKENPLKADAAAVDTGKSLFDTHCKSCHGAKGKGDGPKAAQLDTECGDFTTAAFQKQTDGSLFYKTSEGRKNMPSFKKKFPDANDIWAIVNYLRTLK